MFIKILIFFNDLFYFLITEETILSVACNNQTDELGPNLFIKIASSQWRSWLVVDRSHSLRATLRLPSLRVRQRVRLEQIDSRGRNQIRLGWLVKCVLVGSRPSEKTPVDWQQFKDKGGGNNKSPLDARWRQSETTPRPLKHQEIQKQAAAGETGSPCGQDNAKFAIEKMMMTSNPYFI